MSQLTLAEVDALVPSVAQLANRVFRQHYPHRARIATEELAIRGTISYHGDLPFFRLSCLSPSLRNPTADDIKKTAGRVVEDLMEVIGEQKYLATEENPLYVLDDLGAKWGVSLDMSEPVLVAIVARPADFTLRLDVTIEVSAVVGGVWSADTPLLERVLRNTA